MIELTDHTLELDQMEELALARAELADVRYHVSEICAIGGKKVQCVVRRHKVRGQFVYSALFEVDGWRMAKSQALRVLAGLD